MSKNSSIIFLFCTFVVFFFHNITTAETINQMLASVESEAITSYEVGSNRRQQTPQQIEQSIFEKLVRLDAKRQGISTNQAEIEFYLEQFTKQQGITTETFLRGEKARGLTEVEINKEIEFEILKQKLAQKLIQSKKHQPREEISLDLSQILIRSGRGEKSPRAEKIIRKIQNEYADGAEFEDLVTEYSEAGDLSTKGALGKISLQDLDSDLANQLKKLSVGEISRPIEKDQYWFIFRVNDREVKKIKSPSDSLSTSEMNKLLQEYFQSDLYKKYHIGRIQK